MASEARRIALVIANAAYKVGRPLANPVNDAAAMFAALKRLGFDPVIHHTNLGLIEMGRSLADFAVRADEADMGVIYFAGHGMEVNGENYLLPIDADLDHVRRLPHEAKKLSEAVETLDSVKELGLIILDACRDNPYRGRMRGLENVRSSSGGLAAVELRGNTLVAYAAKHGTQAKDGPAGGNSPYMQALNEHFETPDLDVRLMFGRVRDRVLDLTCNAQEPHIYGTLGGAEIYLKKSPPEPVKEPAPDVAQFDPRQIEHTYWVNIQDSHDPNAFEGFLMKFPEGDYVELARARAEERIRACDRAAFLKRLLRDYPQSRQLSLARNRLAELDWRSLKDSRDAAPIQAFIERWPGSRFEAAARARQEALRRRSERSSSNIPWRVVAAVGAVAVALVTGYIVLRDGTPSIDPPDTSVVKPERPAAEELAKAEDDKAFADAKASGTKAAFKAYLKKKYHRHVDEAKAKLTALDDAAYKAAKLSNTIKAFAQYRNEWSDGQYYIAAGQQMVLLQKAKAKATAEQERDDKAFVAAKKQGTKEALEAYLKKYNRHVEEVKAQLVPLDRAAYEAAKRMNKVKAFQAYRDAWPDGRYFGQAGQQIASLQDAAFKSGVVAKATEAKATAQLSNAEVVDGPAWVASPSDIIAWHQKKRVWLGGALSGAATNSKRSIVAAAAHRVGSVHVFHASTLKLISKITLANYDSYSLDDIVILAGSKRLVMAVKGALSVVDVKSKEHVQHIPAETDYYKCALVLSKDRRILYSVLSSVRYQKSKVIVYDVTQGELSVVAEYSFDTRIDSFDAAISGDRFLISTYPDYSFALFDIIKNTFIWSIKCDCSAKFGKNDELIVFAGRLDKAAGDFGTNVTIGVLSANEPWHRVLFDTKEREGAYITDVSPDGEMAAIGTTNNGEIKIVQISLKQVNPLTTLKDHSGQSVTGAVFVGSNNLVSVSGDNNARLWGR